MDITVENLPPYEAITCTPIREAAAGLDAAKAAKLAARRDLTELEQTREQAEWADAEAAEAARSAGKPEPKRSHAAAHDRKTDEARHELKVAELALQRAEQNLADAIEQHGDAWGDEARESVEALTGQWAAQCGELTALHAQLASALSVARTVVGENRRGAATIGLTPAQIRDIEFASGQGRVTGYVATPDVLAALAELGMPVEPDETKPQQHRPPVMPNNSPTRGLPAVEAEINERREFLERARDPERVQARQKRNEHLRAEREAALAEQAEV